MSESSLKTSVPPPVVALLGWVVPGLGYVLIGQKSRGIVVGVTIVALFVLGILFAGIRVIDVPGYDNLGGAVYVNAADDRVLVPGVNNQWIMRAHPVAEILTKPWFAGQILTGPICLAAAKWSLAVSQPLTRGSIESATPPSHARLFEIGTLYTAVAGLLNLLAMIDASARAGQGK